LGLNMNGVPGNRRGWTCPFKGSQSCGHLSEAAVIDEVTALFTTGGEHA
jgi:hypothetical protein